MNAIEEVAAKLEGIGYTGREARFLELVLEHSGYFLARQFEAFCGHHVGKSYDRLLRRLATFGHATRFRTSKGGWMYHVTGKIYGALGQSLGRTCRRHAPSAIRLRLMGLDFVLSHPSCTFIGYGAVRHQWLVEQRGVPRESLPNLGWRTAVPDRFPAFVSPDLPDGTVAFCYLAAPTHDQSTFVSFLRRHEALFRALGHARVVYIEAIRFGTARTAQNRFLHWRRRLHEDVAGMTGCREGKRLAAHFRRRLWYETAQYRRLTTADVAALRRELTEFQGDPYDRLFETWKAQRGDPQREVQPGEQDEREEPGSECRPVPSWQLYVLPYRYDLFHASIRSLGTNGVEAIHTNDPEDAA